jgi:citrate lyase beta subunit
MTARLASSVLIELDGLLAGTDADFARLYPGESWTRQPVHTAYLPADQFVPDTAQQWGAAALAALDEHAPDANALAGSVGMPVDVVADALPMVRRKLAAEPIEDLRVDFEDGLSPCSDADEDTLAETAGTVLGRLTGRAGAPPYWGIRIRSLEPATRARGVRTLDTALGALLAAGGPPDRLTVTLPKVTAVAQVEAMARLCERLEEAHGIDEGGLRFEVQVETAQAILGPDGVATVAGVVHAAPGRLCGLHFGTYDYSAAVGIAGAFQSLEHPAADHAKAVMQVAAAGTGVRVSDGSTNVLPVGGLAAVRAGWALHARLVRRALERGFYQGWDLHPTQLVTRYLATYAFFRAGLGEAAGRLRAYAGSAATGVQDEPATVLALAGFLLRGLDCGAFTEAEVRRSAGLDRSGLLAHVRRAGR